MSLEALERQVRADLRRLEYPARDWITERVGPDEKALCDVLIIGAGQSGLALAAALKRERIHNVLLVDRHPEGKAGPWLTFARMITLRTPKYLTGPDLGIPSLTIQAWYEAQHGEGAWEALGYIPKETWAEYLNWYRDMNGLTVRYETTAGAISRVDAHACFAVPLRSGETEETIYARRVVMATGIEGSGRWRAPAFITEALPSSHYAHTRRDIDFDALRGKRVGILGAGASAFDNASVALERGAAEVRLCFRRRKLVNVNPYRWAEFVGFLKHVSDLDDAAKWRFILQILRMGQLPPTDTFARAKSHDNFHLHPATPWNGARMDGEEVVVETPQGELRFDYVIAATGFVTDLSCRPELAHCHEAIKLWADAYQPPADDLHDDLLRHPYLDDGFAFVDKTGAKPWLSHIYNYTFGCLLSHGFGGASISGMKYSLPKIAAGITKSFFVEDQDHYFDSLCAYDIEEF